MALVNVVKLLNHSYQLPKTKASEPSGAFLMLRSIVLSHKPLKSIIINRYKY